MSKPQYSEMSKLLILVLSISISLVVAAIPSSPIQHDHKKNNQVVFDQYVLALTWPNSYCKLEQSNPDRSERCLHPDKDDLPQVFTIHGLWPSRSGGGDVPISDCSHETFKFDEMGEKTKIAATKRWPDLKNSVKGKTKAKQSQAFWAYEWKMHGVCSNLVPDAYMDLAMKLYDRVSTEITTVMRSHPHGGTVDIKDFQTALRNSTIAVEPRMNCGFLNSNDQYLRELQFLVENSDPHNFKPYKSTNCDTSKPVKIP